MSKKKKKNDGQPGRKDEFGLNEPTGQFDHLEEGKSRPPESKGQGQGQGQGQGSHGSEDPSDEVNYKNMGWKGIDAEEEEEGDPDVSFSEKEPIPEDELDMTPMVDVTFLLLIFFMVTASFTIQKSLEQAHAKSEQPSENFIEKPDELPDYIQVTIDQTNTYYVTTRDEDEVECPSESEMRAKVKDGKESTSATRLIILAHVDSLHSKVVTAWDAGVNVGMIEIEIQTTEEDY